MDKVEDIVGRLRSAYEKVALWPEKRMAPGAVEEIGIGFNELLELRNLVPEAADLIQSQQALIEEMREALLSADHKLYDMLEALKGLLQQNEEFCQRTGLGDTDQMEAARAAISKALSQKE